jgi:site-specific recombinase XerD
MRGGWAHHGSVTIRLGRPHFAFFRGYLDGLDIGALAARYLPIGTDGERTRTGANQRRAKSLLVWTRKQLLVAARRRLSPADTRLLGIAPSALRNDALTPQCTLEQFQEEQDPYGMFGEAELLRLFEEEYGRQGSDSFRRAMRNDRLRVRQQRCLLQLESLVAADPSPGDRVDGWLDPALAAHLGRAGITVLGDLVALIERYGYRWYNKVPKIGLKAALHISSWLQEESVRAALGTTLPPRALIPARTLAALGVEKADTAPQTGIVVLERLAIPPALHGRDGANRGVDCQLDANDDIAAIEAWLASRQATSNTLRAYRRESERFLLWALFECGKPIWSLTPEDCARYPRFLAMLCNTTDNEWSSVFHLPQHRWIGTPGVSRSSAYWKPFNGAISLHSQRQALIIIRSFLQWLTHYQYLQAHPMQDLALVRRTSQNRDPHRTLSRADCRLVRNFLDIKTLDADDEPRLRRRVLFALAYECGLRLEELAALRCRHLVASENDVQAVDGLRICLESRDGRVRHIALGAEVLQDIHAYLGQRGHPALARIDPDTPLIIRLVATKNNPAGPDAALESPLTGFRMYRIFKHLFAEVAASLPPEAALQAERLRSASAQWLRHAADAAREE